MGSITILLLRALLNIMSLCWLTDLTGAGRFHVILLPKRDKEGNVALLSTSCQAEGKEEASHYALVIQHYGNRHFLSGIKLQGSNITYRLPESKVEAELRAQSVAATDETLRASLK